MWDWSMQSWRDFKKILNRLHRVLLNRYSAENSGDIPDCTGLGDDRERRVCWLDHLDGGKGGVGVGGGAV